MVKYCPVAYVIQTFLLYPRFAYMMMRRYADAIRTFSNILLYVQRTKQMFQVSAWYLYQMLAQITLCTCKETDPNNMLKGGGRGSIADYDVKPKS